MAGRGEEEVKLYKTWSSLFGLRAVWALKLKGIKYEAIDEDLKNKSPSLLKHNPVHKKVPVLLHNGKPVVESSLVLEYIAETWSQLDPPFLPQDPYDKAIARFWAKFGDDKVLASIWEAFKKYGKDQEEAMIEAKENLKILEEELMKKKKTRFFNGNDVIGFLDIMLGWLAYLIPVFDEIIGIKLLGEEEFPFIASWMKDFSSVDVVKETLPPHDKLVAKFIAIRESFAA